MHNHGYKGRKFSRERDQRRALLRGLASSLVIYKSIETTLPKAKELVRHIEKLITKAKKADLANRRLVMSKLNREAAVELCDHIAPNLTKRNSGQRPEFSKLEFEQVDGAQMARIEFVDDIPSKKEEKVNE